MRCLLFATASLSLLLTIFIVPPTFADPVQWIDRCLAEADRQKQTQPAQLSVSDGTCVDTIVRYCAFSDESATCYETLIKKSDVRSKANVANAPAKIRGNSVQQRMYQNLLNLSLGGLDHFPCNERLGELACRTKRALQSYNFSRGIPDWIAKFEEPK